jgi:tRNA 2-thiouridine synthesizing protein A
MTDATLDARGLNCPMPILRARKALKDLKLGQTLEVLATDPLAIPDFEAFCLTTGNELVEAATQDGEHRIVIRVGAC